MADEAPPLDDALRQLEKDVDYILDVTDTSYVGTMDWQREKGKIADRSVQALEIVRREVDRLRAREAAAMAIVRDVAGMRVEDRDEETQDTPYHASFYFLASDAHDTDKSWHQQLVTQARALLAQE